MLTCRRDGKDMAAQRPGHGAEGKRQPGGKCKQQSGLRAAAVELHSCAGDQVAAGSAKTRPLPQAAAATVTTRVASIIIVIIYILLIVPTVTNVVVVSSTYSK